MHSLTVNEQKIVSAGNIISDFQNSVNDGLSSSEKTIAVVSTGLGLVLGGLIGSFFGAAIMAGGLIAGYTEFDWTAVK